jgi:pimeloyl-ACP methyl ester carboxylesterase
MSQTYVSVYKSEQSRDELLRDYDRILANWPVPHEETVFETRSGRTHILLCGKENGRPLLLFHGTGNNSLMWRNNVAQLGEHFRLYLVDTINDPGKSEAAVDFSPDMGYTRWMEEVLDALGIARVLLVGHSKGGWLALNAAITAPARVERVVLLAPAVGINSDVSASFMLKSLAVGLFPSPRTVTSYMQYVSGPGAQVSAGYIDYLTRLLKGTKVKLVKHRQFSDAELKSIAAPVLLVFGDHEVCVDYHKVIERAQACIGPLQVRIVAGAGHALQGEQPETVNALIINHLLGAPVAT